ncbi:hypothetical protein P168DRAFT_283156 [Aspergillus campestris IBT 28561]|uniref:Uncharacterized protein n=1 Tax=Aspergillus campestris (strain IBT 28561) TaxID=1392248 RepID=A0A2I1D0K5_ASPC2|nr:uncharacterized protein P168DRAFT_283156 [Aspergillus campestris IBT 28561]PKY03413.1 hypothetical protein P168DRAFT_283156 [Aspergillus campestris IBT 28561]
MPMNWNADTDAKLLVGILMQLRSAGVKVNTYELAVFMGPECTPSAIENRIVRLRRQVEGLPETPEAGRTPQKTKRKDAHSEPKTPTKKGKATDLMQDSEWPEVSVEVPVVKMEVKKEVKQEPGHNGDAAVPEDFKLEEVVTFVDVE